MIIYIKPLIVLLSFTENKTPTRHLCNVLLNKAENLLVSNIYIYMYTYIYNTVCAFYIFSVSPIINLDLTKVIHKIIY